MDYTTRKRSAAQFVGHWAGRGYEKGDAQVFWTELLQSVVGMDSVSLNVKFEYRTSTGGFIDCYIPDTGVLIEQKGIDVDLDKPELRQGRSVTPLQQALAYAESFPLSLQPRFLVVCNFATFRVYDRNASAARDLENNCLEFTLAELGENPSLISFVTDPSYSRAEKEKRVSMEAGALIGRLHDALGKQYLEPDSSESQHALNVLCVRLVFCLYCEDAGLFPKDGFYDYLYDVAPANMRSALKRLFTALNTPFNERDPYEETTKPFPYVNGGLFEETEEIPNFTDEIKTLLLEEVSQNTDWSMISPTIFGGIFESTLNPETRHAGGMHYTSLENIHKVIDPLFLDDLNAEYETLRNQLGITQRQRRNRLTKFHQKLTTLNFLDPACGSGNFLTETYISLRKLEDDVLTDLNFGQTRLTFEADEAMRPRIRLAQFYGIEINDFAVRVAQTALWIAQLQANNETDMLLDASIQDFPLFDSANIVEGNALKLDWNTVLAAGECSYVMGNPPFLGARNQSKEQKADLTEVFGKSRNSGNIDYVAGWYMKAAQYIANHSVRTGFVSTNSICQGEQVANIWSPIYDLGIRIDFAHDTFRWTNEAEGQAHVFCVVVGFSKLGAVNDTKKLFHHESPDAFAIEQHPANINAYLADAPDAFIWNRSKPLCFTIRAGIGSQPIDDGNYLFEDEEKEVFLQREPGAEKFFHRWLGSVEFINDRKRWVLWLGDATAAQLDALPLCRERIEAVRSYRMRSRRIQTQKAAETPHHFGTEIIADSNSVLIPEVSSQRRFYIPVGFVGPDTFCSNKVRLIPNATLYHFGILQSQVHNAWVRRVTGRLKSDYQYSATVVYNNFTWPGVTKFSLDTPVEKAVSLDARQRIEDCAQAVLNARAAHPDSTLADMYDPNNDYQYPDLIEAHKMLDTAVEAAYGVRFGGDEKEIVSHLFTLYSDVTGD